MSSLNLTWLRAICLADSVGRSKYPARESLLRRSRNEGTAQIMCQFSIEPDSGPEVIFPKLRENAVHGDKLDLTVGEHGVVGRAVHLTDKQGRCLGSGIIGWN